MCFSLWKTGREEAKAPCSQGSGEEETRFQDVPGLTFTENKLGRILPEGTRDKSFYSR